jgi:hypothetical protein
MSLSSYFKEVYIIKLQGGVDGKYHSLLICWMLLSTEK